MPLNHGRLHKWSLQVRAERGNKCALCGGEPDGTFWKRIEAHHIESKDDRPELMYDPKNGVPLCRRCHTYIHNKIFDREHGAKQHPVLEGIFQERKAELKQCIMEHGWEYPT